MIISPMTKTPKSQDLIMPTKVYIILPLPKFREREGRHHLFKILIAFIQS